MSIVQTSKRSASKQGDSRLAYIITVLTIAGAGFVAIATTALSYFLR